LKLGIGNLKLGIMKIILALLVVSALTVVSAFSQDSIEASDDSVTNGPIEAPTAPGENVDVDSVEPAEASAVEAGGQPDQAPDIPNVEIETAPAVDAAPVTGTEIGDAPDLP
jgi:hypothetical protein